MVPVNLVIDQPRKGSTVDMAFHVFAGFIEGRDMIILLQISYRVRDFVIKTVTKTVLLFIVPVSLRKEFGLGFGRNNGR